tara:strand:- start:25 stop:1692 length:1668 start_codon:yes stop_codon:yes gene_type:complete
MSENRFIYLPLGGAGEIGMNVYVYGYGYADKERLIIVDLGVSFPDMDSSPGVDLILPDISWLIERRDRIEAIFITHAHEDHIGALALLWEKLGAPVYARSFTANVARRKMLEKNQPENVVNTTSIWPKTVAAGPFEVAFVPISHSIPESSSLLIKTPAGRIIHSGDFKLDKTPIVGEAFDPGLWHEVVRDGITALVCDSTNVFTDEPGRSEETLGDEIEALVASAPNMVVATTFASNIARLKTLAVAGERAGRSICLLGRAMHRMVEVAIETGVLTEFPHFVSPQEAKEIPRKHLMLLVTGSQGERRAASAQLSSGKFQGIELKEGDLFLFSSKTIPGNERAVIRIINQLSEKGVDVVDEANGLYHVSGHANRPDIKELHNLVQPQIVVPMHGEHRHLREHCKLAEESGKTSLICVNGMMAEISGNEPRIVDNIDTGRLYLDGKLQYGAKDGVIRDRIRMALNGIVLVNIVMDDEDEILGEPWVELRGLPEIGYSDISITDILEEDLSQYLGRADSRTLEDDEAIEAGLVKAVRHSCMSEIGKKPEVVVIISRLS